MMNNNNKRTAIALSFLAAFLVYIGIQVKQANNTAERVVDVVEETKDAIGQEAGQMVDLVDKQELATGLQEGIQEVGSTLKDKIKEKINQ